MKQAKADAQELIDAYRAEKMEEFNKAVLASGKYIIWTCITCRIPNK